MKIIGIPEISKLNKHEKILLTEDLWEEIAADDSDISVSDSHKKELNRRLDKQLSSPGRLLTRPWGRIPEAFVCMCSGNSA